VRAGVVAAGLAAIATIAYVAGARRGQAGAGQVTAAHASKTPRSVPRLIAPRDPASVDDTGPSADDGARERAHQSFMHYFTELEAERTRERPDPEWSPRAEQLIRSFADGDRKIPGVSLQGACGSTLCRVELRSADERLRDRLQRQFHRFVGRELPTMTLHTLPDAGMSLMYLARAGTSLPPMSQDDLRAMN
jgi:hypothetical protein